MIPSASSPALNVRPILIASCVAGLIGASAATAISVAVLRDVRTTLAESERARVEDASRFAERFESAAADAARTQSLVQEAVDQLPVRMAVIDPAAGTSVPVLRVTMRDADRVLGDLEATVAVLPDDGIPGEDVRALYESIRSLDRVGLAPLGPDFRDRVEQLWWVADALEHLASPVADMASDIVRSRALASDPRNCSTAVSKHLGSRIESVRLDGEARIAREVAESIDAELVEVSGVVDPATRMNRLERLALRIQDELARLGRFAPSATACVLQKAAAVDVALEGARADLRRSGELDHARGIAATIDACIVNIAATADVRARADSAEALVAYSARQEAEVAALHDEARKVVRGASDRAVACKADAQQALGEYRAARHRDYVHSADVHLGAFERDFDRADWKWTDWGVDEEAIVSSFVEHVAIIDPIGLPAELRRRHEGAVARAMDKVSASQIESIRFAYGNRNNKSVHPE